MLTDIRPSIDKLLLLLLLFRVYTYAWEDGRKNNNNEDYNQAFFYY